MATITSVNQSADGYIWVGSDGAELVRYDGKLFEEIEVSNANNNHHIRHISFDGENVLFASQYKGFFIYSPSGDSLTSLQRGNVRFGDAMAVFRKGDMYYMFGTRGIFTYDGSSVRTLKELKSNENNLEYTQFIETPDAVFVLSNYGNFRFSTGSMQSINQWLKVESSALSGVRFGYYDGVKLAFLDDQASYWLEVVLNDRGGFYSINRVQQQSPLQEGDRIISCSYSVRAQKGGVLTQNQELFSLSNKALQAIVNNYDGEIQQCGTIFTDLLGDYWVTSTLKGLYKVSEEPFTRIELHPIYSSPTIALPYRSADGHVILSMFDNETYIGNLYGQGGFKRHEFSVRAIEKAGNTTYLGTNTGIRIFDPEKPDNPEIRYFKNQNITFLLADGKHLWVGIAGKGLHRINTETGHIQEHFKLDSKFPLPQYFYTGQVGNAGKTVYFGTNNGILQYDRATKTLSDVTLHGPPMGYYSGVSTRDIYGTCWFTLERGLVGITRNGSIRVIRGKEYFKSTLFYTLASDQYGNLIVGTNKGLTFLKVDAGGAVIDKRTYDDKSGFLGYETNMRSQYVDENHIFLGTVEGLFMVNTDMLEHQATPIPPIILRENVKNSDDARALLFRFQVNNPKAGNIRYKYRVAGRDDHWHFLDESMDVVDLSNLGNGTYSLEVKASYDGVHYSEAASHSFKVQLPLWKTNWFVMLLMGVVIVINLILLNYYKSLDSGKLLNTKDMVVHLRLTPAILLFAAVAAPAAQIVAPILDPALTLDLGQALVLGFVLFTLYFLSMAAKSGRKEYLNNLYLLTALFLIMANYLWEVYASALHPYYIIGVVLIASIAPYILNMIKTTVIFSIIILSISICYVSILNTTVYPKSYFLIAMFMMACLMTFSSYIRYDSLEKLIFISSIINKGNVPAIAFNRDGLVTYSSENISRFANITHDEIIGNNISILNNFIPFGEQFKEKDVTKEFRDGEKYLVPMENSEGTVHWIEWSYKDFTGNIRVILGQDVSEKMELENTYELLVQNAEDFIYRCDTEGRFIFLNDICYTKLGYTRQDLIGKRSVMIIPQEFRNEVTEYYREHFSNKLKTSYREFPIQRKNGDILWLGQYVTTLYSAGSDSHVIGFIALARDITELRAQQQLIEDQRDAITSSISYARRIQYNVLPQESQFEELFDEHFIISRPKDIVSGDFYWMNRVHNSTVLVLADCTGHGVPGSFMTLLGYTLLNSIVLENGTVDPGQILNELDKKLKKYLPRGQGQTAVNDAMEATVCVFDEHSNQLAYACAGSRFLVYEKDVFTMFKGDNKHIGDDEENFESYKTHFADFSNDYSLFLFTDGFQDQFGGPKDKKYSFRRLLELFEENIYLPLSEQRSMIEEDFNRWIGDNQQTDDVTVISIRRNTIKE